jgi:hypothetical protein
MIVEGNAPLAAAYAVNIVAIYQSYRWNAYVEAHRTDPKAFHMLVGDDTWQAGHLARDELQELKFFLGSRAGMNGGPPPPGGVPAHTVTATGPAPTQKKARAAKKKAPAKKKAVVKKKPVKKKAAKQKAPAKKKKSARKKR